MATTTEASASTADRVLAVLEERKGAFVSGGRLAESLGISRNAVWKAVRTLQMRGHDIEGVTGRGYRLAAASSVLSSASIGRHLEAGGIALEYHDSLPSTNDRAKELATAGAPEGTLVVAGQQTAGRGRQGRPFYSPPDTGVYFSLVLRPDFSLDDVALITTYAADCTARAIDDVCGVRTQIKWVNDLFVDGSKVCGILTEASFDAEGGHVAWVVVGIGVNVLSPREAPAGDAGSIMGSVLDAHADASDLRARIVAGTVERFMADYARIPERPHLDGYRSRSLLDGQRVHVESGREEFDALVLGVNDDLTLQVRLDDGSGRALVHGDVHIPSSQLGKR